ncbi:hypothetical protein SEPCBS57363_000632 [Sporothrix epigloea]|uniref:RING-type E3 ubiquitin transferase n=1 Tax=Sporothrix epigloea TaxID=1892477 RepID=A0ABP0D5U9_9PEZI
MASRLGESDEASTADTSTTVAIDDSTQTVADTLEDDTHPLSAGTSSDSLTAQITTPPAMETEQSREAETPESTGAVPANASSTAVSSSSPQGHSGSSYPIATLSDATSSTNLPPSPRTSIPAPIPEPIVTLADVSLSRRSSSSRYQTPLPPLPSIPAERQQQQQPLTAEQLTNVRDCPPSPPLPPYPLQLTATGAAQQLQSHNLPSLAQTEAQPSSQTDTPLPPAPPAPFAPPASPPTPRLPTQDLHPRQRSQQSQEFALPRWQPDSEVTYCPICSQQFSIFVRKHHCRCSPHRITIPYPYIVQPPGSQPYQLQATQISPAGDVSRLGGGERVRLCNPCVPDPNNAPPASSPRAAAAAASTASGASSRHHSRSFGSAHSSSSQLNNAYISPTAAFGQGFFRSNTTPANSTLAESSTLAAPTASASQAQGRHHRHSVQIPNSAQGFGAMLREAYARSEVQAGTHPYGSNAGGASNNSIGQHQRHHHSRSHHTPAPPIAEEDECPVCRRELPQRELPDFEALREAHITQCIFTHSQYMGGGSPSTLSAPAPSTSLPTSPGEASTAAALASAAGAPAPPLRRTGMFPYRATEKDCVDDAECTICLEDFEVGVGMARLECFCRFHEQCILAWFVKHPGCCPVHQHDSFGY